MDAQPASDDWQVLAGVAYRYVRWHFEGLTAWDEVGPDGWASRHIEVGPDGGYMAAAAASEVLEARDTGGIDAVVATSGATELCPSRKSLRRKRSPT